MSAELRKEDCEAAVRNFLKPSSFILKDYKVKPLSDKPFGFFGRHLKITVSVIFSGKLQDLHFFAKLAPTCVTHRNVVIDHGMFSKEIAAYNNLVPELNAFLPSGVTLPVPRCFFTRDTSKQETIPVPGPADEELIILEDVTYQGYSVLENFPTFDLQHCRTVLKAMARFHSSGFLLGQSYKKSFPHMDPSQGIFACAKENFLVHKEGHLGYEWSRYSARSMATAVTKMWPEKFEGKWEIVLAALMEAWDRAFTMAETSCKYANTLCHGDSWTNNLMFAYKEESDGKKTPTDILFVDLQIVRYAPPILDILLFLHVCTTRNFRDCHLKELLKYYYSSLEELMPPDSLEKTLPFTSLLESCDKLIHFGRVMSTGYIPIILGEHDPLLTSDDKPREPFDITAAFFKDRGEEVVSNCERSKSYKVRVEENFQECLEGLGLWKNKPI